MKPKALMRAVGASEPIRPMFGPSGSQSGTCGRSGTGERRGPRTRHARGAGHRAQRREPALVGQTRKRVVLVHELRELAGAEELLDGCDNGADIDQSLRGNRFDVLCGHALAHDTLHTGKARADLVLDQLTNGAKTTVAKVVNVVGLDDDFTARTFNVVGHRCRRTRYFDRGDDVFERSSSDPEEVRDRACG